MPAESEKQAHLMQMALAVKSGKKEISDMPEGVRDKIKKIVDSMSKEKIKHFTNEAKKEKEPKYKFVILYKDGTSKEEEMTKAQRDKLRSGKDADKIKSIRTIGKVEEDGEGGAAAGPPGGATPDNVVGNGPGYYYLGQDAQKRELTDQEKAMLGLAEKTEEGSVKVIGYDDFRAKAVKENFTSPEKITEAINTHFGDFGKEAIIEVGKLPVIEGLIEIKSIGKALSGKYKETQIRKVIDAISDKRSS